MELFKLFGRIMIENSEANQALDDTDKKGEKTSGTFGKLGGAAGALGGLLVGAVAAGATAAAGAIGGLFLASDNMTKALNGLQASTGATDEEMKGMEESLKKIYKNNYGESFEDIAQSMANVKTNTGLTGDALEALTQNALMLRDTFEFEVEESTRAADTLMKQFGITGDEAMTLIAQGAQLGANKNGDLLDVINEYAPQFKAIGMSSEFMMDTLITGAQNGAFSLDKVGDAVKEMNIRMKDGNEATKEALTSIGLNAEQITTAFAKGGEAGEQAFIDVVNALADVDDPMKKNIAGVAIMGTQYEDLEGKAIDALADIGFHTSMTGDTLAKINEIKYDSFGEALQGIGRNLMMGVFEPFQNRVMPIVNEFANWMTSKMPVVEKVAGDTFNTFLDVVTKVYDFYKVNLLPILTNFYNWIQANMPTIRATGETTFNKIKEVASTLWSFFKQNILPIFMDLFNWIQGHMPTIRATAEVAFNKITEVVRNAWAFFKNNLLPILASVYGWVQANMPTIKNIIETAFKVIKNVVEIAWGVFENLLLPVLKKLWDWIEPNLPKIQKTIGSSMENIVKAVQAVVDIFETVTSVIQKAIDWLGQWNDKPAKKKTVEIEEKRTSSGSDVGNNYTGRSNFQGGMTWVGEHGPEIVELPKGTKIHSANDSRVMARGGGIVQHIAIHSPQPLSPNEIARKTLQASRQLAMEWGV